MIFSSGKSVAAIVMAMQVDRGLISYTDEVSKHWPDFAKNGKSEITIADVLRYGLLRIFWFNGSRAPLWFSSTKHILTQLTLRRLQNYRE